MLVRRDMRAYIFTTLERQHIRKYLETSEISDDLYVLLNRVKNNYNFLSDDMKLIEMVLTKRMSKK